MQIKVRSYFYDTDNQTFYSDKGEQILKVNPLNWHILEDSIRSYILKYQAFYNYYNRILIKEPNTKLELHKLKQYIFYKLKNINDKGVAGTALKDFLKDNHYQKKCLSGRTYILNCKIRPYILTHN